MFPKSFLSIFFILIFALTYCHEDTNFEFIVKRNELGILSIPIKVGSSKQLFEAHISTTLSHVFFMSESVVRGGFDESKSTSFTSIQPASFPSIKAISKGRIVKDALTLENEGQVIMIKDFSFFEIDELKELFFYKAAIGFEYQPQKGEEHLSFMKRLYDEKLLYKNMFYLVKKQDKVKLYIGVPPPFYKRENKFKSCSLLKHKGGIPNPFWQCNLNIVYFDESSFFRFNNPITFSIGDNYNCVSFSLYNYVKNRFFTQGIQEKKCFEKSNGSFFITCGATFELNTEEVISYLIDGINIKIKIKDLFLEISEYEKAFGLRHCKNKDYTWSMSYYFLEDSILIFDKENNVIKRGWE